MERDMRVLLVSGSLREGSTNTATLRTVRAVCPAGIEATLYDGMAALPHFNPDADREGEPVDPEVARLRELLYRSDALVVCTPEYAGALPGALKNLLEWTVGDASTYRKLVAWINVAGPAAPTGGADAHESLRKVLGYVDARIVEPACLRLSLTRDSVGADGQLSDGQDRDQLIAMLKVLAAAVDRAANNG
jgi:chromate reductase, NAD(P)H dehydrogenase (quinone)